MPRPARSDLANVAQHVIQRGNDRRPCFLANGDYQRYLIALGDAAARYRCVIHAYVLMTNHAHMLVTPEEVGAVSRMMQALGRDYVAYFNRRHERTGTLWQGRFRSCPVQGDRYLLTCHRYIELNPVRAAIVGAPIDYAWSSHRHYAGRWRDPLVVAHDAYEAIGPTPDSRRAAYLSLIHEAISDDDLQAIRAHVAKQGRGQSPL